MELTSIERRVCGRGYRTLEVVGPMGYRVPLRHPSEAVA